MVMIKNRREVRRRDGGSEKPSFGDGLGMRTGHRGGKETSSDNDFS